MVLTSRYEASDSSDLISDELASKRQELLEKKLAHASSQSHRGQAVLKDAALVLAQSFDGVPSSFMGDTPRTRLDDDGIERELHR